MKERLKELLLSSDPMKERDLDDDWGDGELDEIVDQLLANGVIVPPCKIGDKVYTVLYDDETNQHIVDEQTVTEVGINGIFVSACYFLADDFGDYLPYAELGEEWYLGKEDAYKERDRREDNEQRKSD